MSRGVRWILVWAAALALGCAGDGPEPAPSETAPPAAAEAPAPPRSETPADDAPEPGPRRAPPDPSPAPAAGPAPAPEDPAADGADPAAELHGLLLDLFPPGGPASLQVVLGEEGADERAGPYMNTRVHEVRSDARSTLIMLQPYRRAGRDHSFWIVWDAEASALTLRLSVAADEAWVPAEPEVFTFEVEYVDYWVDQDGDLVLQFTGISNGKRGSTELVPTRIYVHSFPGEGGQDLSW